MAVAGLCAAACGAELGGDETACLGSRAEPIYNGSPEPPQPLDSGDIQALAAVESGDGTVVCTATLIAEGWYITAAHCAVHANLRIRPAGASKGNAALEVARHVKHESLDVMLLQVAQQASQSALRGRIGLWPGPLDAGWLGAVVTLAGAGLTETGAVGELRFVEEPVVDVRPTELWVDGGGRSGACIGDSGGPMLVRDASGAARIGGILARGSADCLGLDVYTRADTFSAWTASTIDGVENAGCQAH